MLVPEGIHDPLRPSGGNTYDRRLCGRWRPPGGRSASSSWPGPGPTRGGGAGRRWSGRSGPCPTVRSSLVDGLVASALGTVVVPACRRLRVVVLMHMPLGLDAAGGLHPAEGALLRAAAAVVTPSAWARSWLLATYGLDPARVHVARPGVDAAPPADGTRGGSALLCVGAVTHGKGQDVLLAALSRVADLAWRCTCVGSLSCRRSTPTGLRRDARQHAPRRAVRADRGARRRRPRGAVTPSADVLVARQPGGDLRHGRHRGARPGPPGHRRRRGRRAGGPRHHRPTGRGRACWCRPTTSRRSPTALRLWLSDADRRVALREAALERRTSLAPWSETADRVGRVLREVAA